MFLHVVITQTEQQVHSYSNMVGRRWLGSIRDHMRGAVPVMFSWSTNIAHVSRRVTYCARVTKVGGLVGKNADGLFEEQNCGDHSLKGWPCCYLRQMAIQSVDGVTMGIPAMMLAPWNV